MARESRYPEIVTMGRSGVDLYPLQTGLSLDQVASFGKFLGGSPTNIAVAAARMGHTSAVITGVGTDPFGKFVRSEMRRLNVIDDYVITTENAHTPVTFCELFPPENFPLYFYREKNAPDMCISEKDIPQDVVKNARVFLISGTGLANAQSRSAHHFALKLRQPKSDWTIADLDYRANFWESEKSARAEISAILSLVNVATGNQKECEIVVGESDPDAAADALLDHGVKLAIIKLGSKGALAKTRHHRIVVPPTKIQTVNGLGAGDAFAGALAHALISGWDIPRAIHFASTAGAIVCAKLECATAMPTEAEVLQLMSEQDQTAPIVANL